MALNEQEYNKKAREYLMGNLRNAGRSMNPFNREPLEKVQPWFGSGGAREGLLSPQAKSPVAQPPPVSKPSLASASPAATAPTVRPAVVKSGPPIKPGYTKRKPEAPTVKDGWKSTPDNSVYGGRTLSMGTPGDPNAGSGYVSGPARRNVDINEIARQNLRGRGQVGGYSFEGSGADFAKFAQQPTRPAMQDGNTASPQRAAYLQVRDRYDGGRGTDVPKYLGPESGLGWKTRLAKYQSELDAYEKATGTRAAMDMEAMRQAGAGQRTIAEAGLRGAELAEQQRQFDEQAPGRQAEVTAKQYDAEFNRERNALVERMNTSKDPVEQRDLYRRLLSMQGKEPSSKYQIATREEWDEQAQSMRRTPFAVNPEDPAQSVEIGGGGDQLEAMPGDKGKLVKGRGYRTPMGPARWDGEKFIPLAQ